MWTITGGRLKARGIKITQKLTISVFRSNF